MPASWLDGGNAVDEREVIEDAAKRIERDFLIFLKGWVMAFALFLTVFLSDVALAEMIDDLVDLVLDDLDIVGGFWQHTTTDPLQFVAPRIQFSILFFFLISVSAT